MEPEERKKIIEEIRLNNIKIERKRLEDLEKRRLKALEKAKHVAELLKRDYKATKVTLFGSLARGDFREHSDIDIYIEGFQGNFFRAWADADRLGEDIEINLVCDEDAHDGLKESVLKEGIAL